MYDRNLCDLPQSELLEVIGYLVYHMGGQVAIKSKDMGAFCNLEMTIRADVANEDTPDEMLILRCPAVTGGRA